MGIELHHLRGFLAVAEERQFTRAASRLHVTQPTLSRTIRVLEEQMGERLLDRTTRRVALTLAGERLYRDLSELLPRLDAALRSSDARVALRLVFAWGLPGTWLREAVVRFEEATGVQVDLIRRDNPLAELERGEADAALAWGRVPSPSLPAVTILHEARIAAVGRGSVWAARGWIDWFEFVDIPLVANVVSDATPPEEWVSERRPRVAARVGNLEEGLEAVAADRGIAVVPEAVARRYAHPSVVFIPVRHAPAVPLNLVSFRQGRHPLAAQFVDMAFEAAAAARH
ncbi:LysR family transcriptional regulator [Kitasatospora sp. NPDC036755]|uniref:LysR family transcriptional regulator n=1 Tax=Kitasatospora sp. NPDC036755 TaxID=3154600 RepID=UPI003400F26A